MEENFTKKHKLVIYGMLAFFVVYYVQALYYGYFFYDSSEFFLGAVDWSIYSQALQLINWHDLNPYLSIRGIRIFNDHFDPIIVPFALTFAKIFPPALVMVTVEIFFVVASAWLVYWYALRKTFSPSATILIVMYLLFNPRVIHGLLYPSHPTVWSTFAFVCLGIAWMERRFKWVLASLVFLYCFKEEFPLVGFMVAIAYFYKKEWRYGLIVFLVTGTWFWFTQHRSLFFEGWQMNYNGQIYRNLIHPLKIFDTVQFRFLKNATNFLVLTFIIFLPILYLVHQRAFKMKSFSWEILFFSSPLFFTRTIFNGFMASMVRHYLVQISTLWGIAMFGSIKTKQFSRGFLLLYFFFLFLSSNVFYDKWEHFVYWASVKNWRFPALLMVMSDEITSKKNKDLSRKKALDEVVIYIGKIKEKANIFAHDPLNVHFIENRYVYETRWSNWENLNNISEVYADRDEQVRPRLENENYLVSEKSDFVKMKDKPFVKNFMSNAEIVIDNEYVVVVKKPPIIVSSMENSTKVW